MVTIKEAVTKKDLVKFMEFPLELYKNNPYYVPDILASQVADMQRDKNPAFAFCQSKAFLAYRDGEIVGRIQGILNDRANATFNKKYMCFTQVDFIDDDEVVDALFDRVKTSLIAMIAANPQEGEYALDLLMIAKYFERIGDHAVNIAEWVEFSVTGKHKGECQA